MPSLEKLVRPFQNDRSQPTRKREYWNGAPAAAPSTTEPEEESVITWSARANVDIITLPGLNVILPSDDDSDFLNVEISRVTHIQRFSNEADPDQFIDVEVMDAVELINKAKQKRRLEFNN